MSSARRTRVLDERLTIGNGDADVDAFVVEPADGENRGGILFLHWLGDHRSDRSQFLSEAREYARIGIRSVLPAGNLPWVPDPADAETDLASIELEQRRLGAALERLRQGLPQRTPLALVGHDFGAMHGLVLAARRPVFKAAVLIAATPRWGDWFLRFWKVDVDQFDYLRALSPVDPVTVARDLTASTLWQFSDRDFFIAPMSAVELARAQPLAQGEQPVIEWYAADHAMRSAKARAARRAFLARELRIE
ncbi:MAG TPA: alpha/beta fold hydrolase [Candidatus Limnocylindria bacterium]|nr:alpha/beta fold hydrolase [Candidatus Limnocylindria bacterium]